MSTKEESFSYIVNLFLRKMQHMSKIMSEQIDLTPSQMRILLFIKKRQEEGTPVFQKDIEHEFHIRGSSVTSVLNNLEKKKWIKRERVDFDARLKSIVFDENANILFDHAAEAMRQCDEIIRSALSDAELLVFKQCIEKISAVLDAAPDPE